MTSVLGSGGVLGAGRGSRFFRRIALAAAFVAWAAPAAVAKTSVDAAWGRGPVTVDGSDADWSGALVPLPGSSVAMGARNDGDYLYVCFSSADQDVVDRVAVRGLSLHVAAKGSDPLTIEYPIGALAPLASRGTRPRTGPGSNAPAPASGTGSAGHGDTAGNAAATEMVLSGGGMPQPVRIPVGGSSGIDVRTSTSRGRFVYEARIPLARGAGHPFAVGAGPGKDVEVTFETAKIDPDLLPTTGWGGITRGGYGGRDAAGTGGMGGRADDSPPGGGAGGKGAVSGAGANDEGESTGSKPRKIGLPGTLKLKARVKLAAAPGTAAH
jgi:hypothetical protein